MNYLPRLFAGLLLTACASTSFALDCTKAVIAAQDTEDCDRLEQQRIEANLNKLYQVVLKKIDGQENGKVRTNLIAAQRAWVKFREADCEAVYQFWIGGSIRTTMYIGCMKNRAETRIKELQDLIETH